MKFEDLKFEIELLVMKISALNNHAYSHLESVESSLESPWCKENQVAFQYMKEANQYLYISTTLIRDIQKDVERLNEKTDNVRPDQETTLPALNEQ